MTTQTTTIRTNGNGMRALIGTMAASLAVLGGALLWQGRQGGDTALPRTTSVGTLDGGAAADAAPPFGVPALTNGFGRYATAPQASAAGVPTDGMTERDEGRAAAVAAPDLAVPALTDGAGRYLTAQQLAATRATTERVAERDEERAAAPTPLTLVVASPDDIPEAYARFVERLRALDGSTPVAVTLVGGSAGSTAARGAASGDCGTTSHLGPTDVGPVDC